MARSPSIRVLVTGGAGYIGSHVVLKLLEEGYRVTVIDNFSTGLKARIPQDVQLYVANIGDEQLLDRIFEENNFDIVMHFSASIKVNDSLKNPSEHYRNNFSNTIILLDVMRKHRVDKIIFSSTSAIFGNPETIPVNEQHACNPMSPYGMSKLMCEHALAHYEKAYGMHSVCLRYFNASGADPKLRVGFDKNDMTHLIPVALQAAAGEISHIKILGVDFKTRDGTGVRDYIHVMDLCQAHLLGMCHLLNGGSSRRYNLGNGHGFTVKQVINTTEQVTGASLKLVNSVPRPGDPVALVADSTLIKQELGWKPMFPDLKTIIEHSWAWKMSQREVAV